MAGWFRIVDERCSFSKCWACCQRITAIVDFPSGFRIMVLHIRSIHSWEPFYKRRYQVLCQILLFTPIRVRPRGYWLSWKKLLNYFVFNMSVLHWNIWIMHREKRWRRTCVTVCFVYHFAAQWKCVLRLGWGLFFKLHSSTLPIRSQARYPLSHKPGHSNQES